MSRKRWTPKTEVSDSLTQFREKRKWQIALRRYVLDKNKSSFYAPYFGLDHTRFRQWIEVQFDEGLAWENFSEKWQFDHVLPLAYFDFAKEEDLRLCWNFINIRVDRTEQNGEGEGQVDVLSAKAYFEELFQETGYQPCLDMVEKIKRVEAEQIRNHAPVVSFINQNKDDLAALQTLSAEDFDRLNAGMELRSLLYEKEFLKKFGS